MLVFVHYLAARLSHISASCSPYMLTDYLVTTGPVGGDVRILTIHPYKNVLHFSQNSRTPDTVLLLCLLVEQFKKAADRGSAAGSY